MKKTRIILLSTIGFIVISIGTVYFGSKILGYNKNVDSPIFQPEREWIYEARFYDASRICIDTQTIILKVHDERFMLRQTKITWTFEKAISTTGVVENKNKIWIHPPRADNYYEFTEFAPFPEIQFPIEKSRKWEGTLSLGSYATEQTGNKLEKRYWVADDNKTIKTRFLESQAVEVNSEGISGLGTYKHMFYFHDQYGFIYSEYQKSNGERLIIELVDVEGFKNV